MRIIDASNEGPIHPVRLEAILIKAFPELVGLPHDLTVIPQSHCHDLVFRLRECAFKLFAKPVSPFDGERLHGGDPRARCLWCGVFHTSDKVERGRRCGKYYFQLLFI